MQLRELGLIAEQLGCSLAQLAIGIIVIIIIFFRPTGTSFPGA